MCKKSDLLLSLLMSIVVWIGVANADLATGLIGHWEFEEGSGDIAADQSGNGNDGQINGTAWAEGRLGAYALEFNGTTDDHIWIGEYEPQPDKTLTVALWAYARSAPNWASMVKNWGGGTTGAFHLGLGQDSAGRLDVHITQSDGATVNVNHTELFPLEDWHHCAVTADSSRIRLYLDGEEVAGGSYNGTLKMSFPYLAIGVKPNDNGGIQTGWGFWDGFLDSVRIYDRALTQEELQLAMVGVPPELAGNPSPEKEATDVLRETDLTWTPGQFAATHDVYFGTVFDDVNEATQISPLDTLVSQGQDANSLDVGVLEYGQTYYWRVDEVNGTPDSTIFKGDTWGFTVEALSIPVAATTATASSSHADNMGPENTINGIGLNELDQHSTEGTEMWLSGVGDTTPSIQYEFDKAYKLHELWVWNSNQLIEAFVGLGAKDVVIESTLDGVEWTVLEGAILLDQATGTANYAANTIVDFGGVLAQAVKITINAGYGMMPQYGLSAVRFLHIPTFAREPEPANGSNVASADVVLGWRSGREAASSEVYLSTDVADLALLGATTGSSMTANGLSYSTTYFWSVTEVNSAEAVTSYAGDVWSFTTPDFGTVDDFDQYDDKCRRIFFAWEDGLGHNGGEELEGCAVPPSNGNGGGSIVGNATAPFAEKTIVNVDSRQSLPLEYDNAFGPSETTLTLARQDWTTCGVRTLSVFFYGQSGNTGQLYVKINSNKVVYSGDAADITQAQWQRWDINLMPLAGLQEVTTLTIGVDGASAAGMLYIDDIRLYP